MDGQDTKWRRNIAKNFNRLSRAHERYRQTTDGRPMTYSEHELEFTFANKKAVESDMAAVLLKMKLPIVMIKLKLCLTSLRQYLPF